MTGPDRIWIDRYGGKWSHADGGTQDVEYVRRDPAVLAALPEVQALIAAAYEVAAKALDHVANNWDCGHMASRLCDCAPLAEQWGIAAEEVRFLTPADATAALAARDAAMIARGMREYLTFDGADWFWRVMDPDDNGDNPSEAITRGYIGQFTVCEIACSYRGPTRFGFNAPVLDHESDEDEFLHFETQQEAIDAAKDRRAAILARAEQIESDAK